MTESRSLQVTNINTVNIIDSLIQANDIKPSRRAIVHYKGKQKRQRAAEDKLSRIHRLSLAASSLVTYTQITQ